MDENYDSPYMLLVAPVQNDKCNYDVNKNGVKGLDKLNLIRSVVPAITHVDYSARVQTVDPERHGRYYRLINRFHELTGSPVVINTSFNVRGEPIVCSPKDAYHCFMGTHMDVLVINNFVLIKDEQPKNNEFNPDEYLSTFALD